MSKSVLFVLGALGMGGVETYVVRMTKELVAKGHKVDILLLSNKIDSGLRKQLGSIADIIILEKYPYFKASSWLNGMSRLRVPIGEYDIVHVVDLLTLGFVHLNRDLIDFKYLSIGIYHSAELEWWRDRGVYFRDCHIRLFDRNVGLNLFPNESTARAASRFSGVPSESMRILPLGVDLEKYSVCAARAESRKIVSVGRLVAFKTYNRHVISVLPELRRTGDYHYYIYGDGPESENLKRLSEELGVADCVRFEGAVAYDRLPEILDGAFCFVGSGTSIIEASAAGIPSIVGIESMEEPVTCGFFEGIDGFSYNESGATSVRIPFGEAIEGLARLDAAGFESLSRRHREKAAQFDLRKTSCEFLRMSNRVPNFEMKVSRLRAIGSFFLAVLRFGPAALKTRFDQTTVR